MVLLAVHVTPKSGRDEVVGWRGSELAVRVTAPPEGGKANAAVCKVVAGALGMPKSSVCLVRGESARHKVLDVADTDESELRRVFGQPEEPLF